MGSLKQFFTLSILLLSFSVLAKAQQPPDYLFLQLLDSAGKPVVDATVESSGEYRQNNRSEFSQTQKTYEKGEAGFVLPWHIRDFTNSVFRVSKTGYYPFQDLGFMPLPPRYGVRATLELLKIPETKKERKALGDEQLKREFMQAVKFGDAATVRRLLKAGINPNLKTNELRGIPGPQNVPAILLAAVSGDSETVKTLLEGGVNIRVAEEPIHGILAYYLRADPYRYKKAVTDEEKAQVLENYEKGVEILIRAGADFNVEPFESQSILMTAANRGYIKIVKTMLDHGFSVNSSDRYGKTVLMYAANNPYAELPSKAETIKFLLKAGADPNIRINNCGTVLNFAAASGDLEVIKALVAGGADVNSNCPKSSIVRNAVDSRKAEVVRFLIEAGAKVGINSPDDGNIMILAAKQSNPEMVRLLLEKGFSAGGEIGTLALSEAIDSLSPPNLETIKLLLGAGADPNVIRGADRDINTCSFPLLNAARRQQTQLIKFLAANGAKIDLACGSGETALIYAITQHNPEVVKSLIDAAADVQGEKIDQALDHLRQLYKEGDYYRKYADETIKLVEDARAKEKTQN